MASWPRALLATFLAHLVTAALAFPVYIVIAVVFFVGAFDGDEWTVLAAVLAALGVYLLLLPLDALWLKLFMRWVGQVEYRYLSTLGAVLAAGAVGVVVFLIPEPVSGTLLGLTIWLLVPVLVLRWLADRRGRRRLSEAASASEPRTPPEAPRR